jgi:hypothetical protein
VLLEYLGFNAIVGTAISASLLPPIVNSGLCLGFGLMHWLNFRVSDHDTYRFARLGVMSLVLWFTNFCMILIVGFLTFRYVVQCDLFVINHSLCAILCFICSY